MKTEYNLYILSFPENFMTGLRVVFDRERRILGWKKFNCYDTDSSNPLSTNSRNSSGFSPSTSENYSPEEARNPTGVSQLRPLNNSSPGTLQDSFLFMLLLIGSLVHYALIPLVGVGLIRL